MPYKANQDLPARVKGNLPRGAQTIFRKAFNNAEEQYKEERRAFKVAWATVKKKYKKQGGKWVKK